MSLILRACSLILLATTAWAGVPWLATAPGSTSSCGVAGLDTCQPTTNVLTTYPPAPLAVVPGGIGMTLVPGDVVSSLSFASSSYLSSKVYFSVTPGSVGLPGSAVSSEATAGEAAADVFFAGTLGVPVPNVGFIDGDGLPAAAAPALGLTEPDDDIGAMAGCEHAPVGSSGSTWFTLGPGSPTLTAIGATPADVLITGFGVPFTPSVWIPASYMGLTTGDVIDALAFDFVYVLGPERVMFSLAPGSPTLALIGAGPADILIADHANPALPTIAVTAAAMGLAPGDDIDALEVIDDFDGDMAEDFYCDNCQAASNPEQTNSDYDIYGDACDFCTDSDNDFYGNPGFPGNTCPDDNCPSDYNNDQADGDGDGIGDACDVCPLIPSPDQTDSDDDGLGDACDTCPLDPDNDTDGDGVCGDVDVCPAVPDPLQADAEGDGVGDLCDNCIDTANPGQEDEDFDGEGTACDACTLGAAIGKPIVKISKLGSPGLEKLTVKGTLHFPGTSLPISPLDADGKGMRLRLRDGGAGNAVIFDHLIPPGAVGTQCDPKDGWKTNAANTTQSYKNVSTALSPACVPGSSLGIIKAKAQDKTASGKGAKASIGGKNSTYGPVVGPLHVEIAFGGAAESAAGQCGEVFVVYCTAKPTSVICKGP